MSDFQIPFQVRDATADDLPAVARLYAHYVRDSHATFDLEPPSVDDWRTILEDEVTQGPHVLLVAVAGDNGLVGYTRTHTFNRRAGYRTSASVSIYVAPGAERQGVGGALYDELFERLDDGRFHRVYAGIALPNGGSIRFHQRYGFALVGTYHEVGHKHGRYWDVSWLEKAFR
ncbi:MAG: GNAT family N-acetyltransferase [Actinobacteria bacterium]|nr:GNAT family N-acetyltransferase [Actinomycetota bacterium]